jgi:AcrR family transcriptional regulator
MPRTKVDHNRADNIVEAAEELFARYGYERTSIEDIARHLDIGKGSIYLDFHTKEEILFRILERHAEKMQAELRARLERKDGSPLALLKETFEVGCVSVYDRVTRDIHTPEALLHTSIKIKHHFADFFISKRALLLQLLRKAADAREIPRAKATEEVALALMMATSSLYPPYLDNYSETVTITSREELTKRAAVVVDLLISGLKN